MMTESNLSIRRILCLADTNIIFRSINPNDPQYSIIQDSLSKILENDGIVYITPQNLIEFQALATRPREANGLGLTTLQASAQAQKLEEAFELLPETPDIYPTWRKLVNDYGTTGRVVYDARIVAVMVVYQIPTILTLNPTDFRRYREITVLEPQSLRHAITLLIPDGEDATH